LGIQPVQRAAPVKKGTIPTRKSQSNEGEETKEKEDHTTEWITRVSGMYLKKSLLVEPADIIIMNDISSSEVKYPLFNNMAPGHLIKPLTTSRKISFSQLAPELPLFWCLPSSLVIFSR
jgi:hypothetical protein